MEKKTELEQIEEEARHAIMADHAQGAPEKLLARIIALENAVAGKPKKK